jgi:fructose-1,6-bisphosphatase
VDIAPATLHQRTPLFIGSPDDVADAEAFVQERHGAVAAERRAK